MFCSENFSVLSFSRNGIFPSVDCLEGKAHIHISGHIGGGQRTGEQFLIPCSDYTPVCCCYSENYYVYSPLECRLGSSPTPILWYT